MAFDRRRVLIEQLCDAQRTLHIDSKVLDKAEEGEEPIASIELTDQINGTARKLTKKQQAELLRLQVDTVGQIGKPGEQIQNVISVGMLSEGWDAKTVTHIMGLRAFSSQLLCEQVVGRGLRRTSYDVNPATGMFDPEYVNIFGVPFTFLPHESQDGVVPKPPNPKTAIEAVADKAKYEISWPNVIRIEHLYSPRLSLDWDKVDSLELDAGLTAQVAELAPIMEGQPDLGSISPIRLAELAREYRTQRIIFEAAREVYDQMQNDWRGNKEFLLAQVVRLVEQFIRSDKIFVTPAALPPRQFEAGPHHYSEYDESGPAYLGGDPVRQHEEAGTCFRPEPADLLDRRHGNLVYRQALPTHFSKPYQFLRLGQHMGSVRRLSPGRQPGCRGLGEKRSSPALRFSTSIKGL